MKRQYDPAIPERMDEPGVDETELEKGLRNLTWLNRAFGGYRIVGHYLRKWFAQSGASFRILDLATGAGDIPAMILSWGQKRNVSFEIDAIDFHPGTLELARRWHGHHAQVHFLEGDARIYQPGPENKKPYDAVICSLALHHFTEQDAIAVMKNAATLSDCVLISDLVRSRINCALIDLLTLTLMRHPLSQQDARMSIRRAFTRPELRRFADEAGWSSLGTVTARVFPPCRQAILWRKRPD